jgi:predicted esterase
MKLDTELVPALEKNSRRLMLVLHGLGDSMEGYRWVPDVFQLPWMNILLVNAPDPYYGGFSWFDFEGDPAPGIERSRSLLFASLDHWRDKGYPTESTTLFGFSQGCLMAWEVGMRYGHRLAGLVGISGFAYEPEKALTQLSPVAREQRFLVTHGTTDPMIQFARVKQQVQHLQQGGLNVEWHEFHKDHTIAGHEEIAVIRDFVIKGYPEH